MFGYQQPMTHSPSASPDSIVDLTSKVLQLTFSVASLIAAMLLNGLVAYTLARKRRFAASAGNRFVFSLTSSNFVNAIFSLPMLIAAGATDTWKWGSVTCQISAFVHLLVGVNGNLTLAMIAYDRYHAIVKPLKYHNEISGRRAVCMLISGWTLSIVITAAPLWGWSSFAYHPSLFVCSIYLKHHPIYTLVLFIGLVLAPLLIMCVCYGYIYLAARFQHYSIAHQIAAAAIDSVEVGSAFGATAEDPLLKRSQTKLLLKLPWVVVTYSSPDKAKRTLFILLCSYSLCWGVVVIWAICDAVGRTPNALAFACYFINSLTAVANPLIYGFMNQAIRRRIMAIVCRRRIGRRGTGGRQRRKRAKAISLQPPPSPSPSSSPIHSANNSSASFFDYLPKQKGGDSRGMQGESIHGGSISSPPRAQSGVDSYDIIRLWTRKFNPSGLRSPRKRRQGEAVGLQRSPAGVEDQNMEESGCLQISIVDAGDGSPNVDMKLFDPADTEVMSKNERSGDRRKLHTRQYDGDQRFLSPRGASGSRLSSMTEFTDVPPFESSTCVTCDDD